MKITHQYLFDLINEELNKTLEEENIDEGVLDYLKGAGQSAGGKIADTGKAIKNKVGQVAGDIKNAGMTASVKADVQKAVQESGLMAQKFTKIFKDLLHRADALRMDDEVNQIKKELGALQTYQETAARGLDQTTSAAIDDVKPAEVAPTQEPKAEPVVQQPDTSPSTVQEPIAPTKPVSPKQKKKTTVKQPTTKQPTPPKQKQMSLQDLTDAYRAAGNRKDVAAKNLGITPEEFSRRVLAAKSNKGKTNK